MVSGIDLLGVEQPKKSGIGLLEQSQSVAKSGLELLGSEVEPKTYTPEVNPPEKLSTSPFDVARSRGFVSPAIPFSKEEYDTTRPAPIITDEDKQGFIDTAVGLAKLSGQPYDMAKGIAEFAVHGIPSFMMGIGFAAENIFKEGIPRFLSGGSILDIYNSAASAFEHSARIAEPARELLGEALEIPRQTIRQLAGDKVTKYLLGLPENVNSELVGAVGMSPATGVTIAGRNLAERFDNENVKGVLHFATDAVALAALGKAYHGGRMKAVADVKAVEVKAKDIVRKEDIANKIPDEAIKETQKKLIEMEKIQLDLQAKELMEGLDYGKMIKEDLSSKTSQIRAIKQNKRDILDEQIDKGMEGLPKEKVEEFRGPAAKREAEMSVAIDEMQKSKTKGLPEKLDLKKRITKKNLESLAKEQGVSAEFLERFLNSKDIPLNISDIVTVEKDKLRLVPKLDQDTKDNLSMRKARFDNSEEAVVALTILKEKGYNIGHENIVQNDAGRWQVIQTTDTNLKPLRPIKIEEPKTKGLPVEESKSISNLRTDLAEKYSLDPHDQIVLGEEISPSGPSKIIIQNLFIPKKLRRQGIGSSVVKDIQQYATENRKEIVTSGVKQADIKFFIDRGFVKDGDVYKWTPEKPEPITDLDLQTGVREPIELSTENSPFRDPDSTATSAMKKVYDEHGKGIAEDPELFVGKMINDVNRWLNGEEVNIESVRSGLSELATRAEELRDHFIESPDYPGNFMGWKEMVEEAANWGRKADRSKIEPSDITLKMGIDPKDIVDFSRSLINSIKGRVTEPRPPVSVFDDLVTSSKVSSKPKIDLRPIETEFTLDKANLLPTLLKDISNQNPSRTMIYELMQNSLDALGTKKGNIDISVDFSDEGPKLKFTDDGKGMSPQEVKKFFLVGGSIGKSGTSTRGGYGLAKIPLLLIPKRIKLTTTRNGVKSIVEASREDIYDGKITINPSDAAGEKNGTVFEAELPNEIYDSQIGTYEITNAIERVVEGTWTNTNITSSIKRMGDIEHKPIFIKPSHPLSEAKEKAFPVGFELDKSKVTIHFVETESYGNDWNNSGKIGIDGMVTNKGLVIDIPASYLINASLPVKPDFKVIIDFEKTTDVRDSRYPFLKNRTELTKKFRDKISDLIKPTINDLKMGIVELRGAKFKDMVGRSREINGVKILNPYEGKWGRRAEELIDTHLDLIEGFSKITSKFTSMLKNAGEESVNFHLTIDPNVYGYKSNKALTGVEIYAINPFGLNEKIVSGSMFREASAAGGNIAQLQSDIMTHALVHEYAHKKHFSHSESWGGELARVTVALGHENLYDLSLDWRDFYGKYKEKVEVATDDFKYLAKSREGLSEGFTSLSNRGPTKGGKGFVQRMEGGAGDKGVKLYSGIPLDKAAKEIIKGADEFAKYVREAGAMKEFKPMIAAQMLREEFNRAFIERSGNLRIELLNKLGNKGYEIAQKMYLSKGASSLSANALHQMKKEVYSGLTRDEKRILNSLILADRMIDIGKYKTKFKYPKKVSTDGKFPDKAIKYRSLFKERERLSDEKAADLVNRAKSYFDWMKKPLKDMLDAELISQAEYDALASHNYRRIKLVDVFDKKQPSLGPKGRTVYDSGVETLARGRETDIYEPSSEVMALEVFNRAYGRILNNRANQSMAELARDIPDNPFARIKVKGGEKIPGGWKRTFYYKEGKRETLYLSPETAKEWIMSNPEMTYRLSQLVRYASGSPVLRAFATGINWGFAFANLPRDIMHTWFAAREFKDGKWKPIYNPNLPSFAVQMGRDLTSTFTDAMLRKGRYEDYIRDGGGMEFLVHQGRLFQRGKHVEGPIDNFYNFMGYLGETSEIMTRLAIRERVIRRRAREEGISVEAANKNKDIAREATFVARDYMDFGQGGGITKALDNGLPYLNAAVVGTRGLVRSFKPGSGSALSSTYKLSQFAALTSGLYIASWKMAPETAKALQGNIDMQNNLCIPLGDGFGFEDEKGQMRYPYVKIPLDPGQKFFKTVFEGCADRWLGNEVDVDRIVDSLKEQSPVGVTELPPLISGPLGYVTNKDFWLNEDIWRKTDKPAEYQLPKKFTGEPIGGSEEEYVPGQTPQAYIDFGANTGLSPERTKYMVEELVTNGTVWSWLLGQGYDAAFGDLPKEQKEQHLAMVLSKLPIIKRFFDVTHPYSQFAKSVDKAKEDSDVNRWTQNRGLDLRVDGYLYDKNVERKEVYKYMNSFKDVKVYDRLEERFRFKEDIKDLPNRSFWLRLKGLTVEARARVYVERYDNSTPEERKEMYKEESIVIGAGGVFSDSFYDEVSSLRSAKRPLP